MTPAERDSITAICLLAAFADGQPDDREREHIKQIADRLGAEGGVSTQVYQRVIFKQTDAAAEAAQISSPELKRSAFDMAVAVCDADGSSSAAEKDFLTKLASALGISADEARKEIEQVDLLASAPVEAAGPGLPAALAAPIPAAPDTTAQLNKDIDGSILNYSILTGALELLPQSLASAAIIPIQMKMVYSIGKRHGHSLSTGHIKDFLATIGIGVTSQVLEGFARRLMGGLMTKVAGKVVGKGLANSLGGWTQTATGAAFTFASTYALGQVARQYYAGGRKMSAIDLKSLFTTQVSSAQQMYEQVRPKIEEQARKLSPSQIMSMVRGG